MQKTKQPLFDLGQLVATPGALAALEKTGQNAMEFLSRHATGDWGSQKKIRTKTNSASKKASACSAAIELPLARRRPSTSSANSYRKTSASY
jgi:hypothetical protein